VRAVQSNLGDSLRIDLHFNDFVHLLSTIALTW
jgi:hypothetical protein